MMRTLTILVCLLFFSLGLSAQVSINDDASSADPSAVLHVHSNNKGFLPPRMTQAQRDEISNPANGLLVYQTDAPVGFYFLKVMFGQDYLKPPHQPLKLQLPY